MLSYSSRACVGGAANTLGYKEAAQVGDALAYLATRPEVDANRIAIHGFSAGGAAAIMAAAQFPTMRAVVAEGGYHDFVAEVEQNTPHTLWFAPLFRFGARAGLPPDRRDVDMSVLSPISVIGQIAPRPILLIYGTNEPGLDGRALAAERRRVERRIVGSPRRDARELRDHRAGGVRAACAGVHGCGARWCSAVVDRGNYPSPPTPLPRKAGVPISWGEGRKRKRSGVCAST